MFAFGAAEAQRDRRRDRGASNRLIPVEDLSEKDLAVIHAHYRKLADMAKSDLSILQSHSIDEAEARHERKRRAHQPNT